MNQTVLYFMEFIIIQITPKMEYIKDVLSSQVIMFIQTIGRFKIIFCKGKQTVLIK